MLDLALAQLDQRALEGEILIRGDGAGATHELRVYCREGNLRFSFGFDLTEPVLEAIAQMPDRGWINAIRTDGTQREHSQVCEITELVNISSWPERSRLIARRTELKEGGSAVLRRPGRLPAVGVHHRPASRQHPSA